VYSSWSIARCCSESAWRSRRFMHGDRTGWTSQSQPHTPTSSDGKRSSASSSSAERRSVCASQVRASDPDRDGRSCALRARCRQLRLITLASRARESAGRTREW
jgi:hypothetical protein